MEKRVLISTRISGAIALALFVFACAQVENSTSQKAQSEGALLAQIHCVGCHQYPSPELLDKATWKNYILPRMGYMMGVLPIDSIGFSFMEEEAIAAAFSNPMLFRAKATLNQKEWQAIADFYLSEAPSSPILATKNPIEKTLSQFKVKVPNIALSPPSSTLVKFSKQNILLGDANTKRIYFLNQNMDVLAAANTREGAVWVNEVPDGIVVTSMGSFSPTDKGSGLVMFLPSQQNQASKILIDSLRRPVHTAIEDLDGDGIADFVICEFSKWTGNLSWWKNDGKGKFTRNILRDMPGATKAYIQDLNKDNLPDIIALFGQGDEGIFIYYNEGNGKFREERVLQFPPSYGSSYFNLFDYNGDEFPDLIYTNGDNADYPPIDKAYHGIRIFQNNGKNQFKEVFFYPLQGAYAAIANDFDQDGDLDIAAISFFPNYQTAPEESFVYLENKGRMQFSASTFPTFSRGRWLVMDSGDMDNDGDTDLILGALSFEVVPPNGLVEEWVKLGIPFIILENTAK
jgi:hypothetical protein